jgi:teichuronic acid biosynthesis glycosyltransferase TuaH
MTLPIAGTDRDRLALAVADVGWYTTENLFAEVPKGRASTLLLRCNDVRVAWNKGQRPWNWNRPMCQESPGLWRRDLVLPSGWMKSYPRIGMRPIARTIRTWRDSLDGDGPLALVMTYPYYLHLADLAWPDRLIYFNIDDYRLYWPRSADQVTRMEHRAVRESDLTVCTSLHRAEELRQAVPEAAFKIQHLPHGAPSTSIADSPQNLPAPPPADIAHLPRPLIGYVGTLEDRVDWALMNRLAQTNPTASIILVGRVGPDGDADWQANRRACLASPNVHAIGWRGQEIIDTYNRSFDVGLIPYRVDHPFNVACCPTKIMDYMAVGRPVVATDLPECRLYSDLFDVVEPGGFEEAVRARLASGPDDGRAGLRLDHARANSCRAVAGRLLDWIEGTASL